MPVKVPISFIRRRSVLVARFEVGAHVEQHPGRDTATFFATSIRLWPLAKPAKAKTAVASRVPRRPCAEVAAGRSSRRAKQAGCRSCSFLRFGCADPLPQLRCYLVVASRFGQVQGGMSAMVADVGVSARADQPVIACNEHSYPGHPEGHPEWKRSTTGQDRCRKQ